MDLLTFRQRYSVQQQKYTHHDDFVRPSLSRRLINTSHSARNAKWTRVTNIVGLLHSRDVTSCVMVDRVCVHAVFMYKYFVWCTCVSCRTPRDRDRLHTVAGCMVELSCETESIYLSISIRLLWYDIIY